MAIVMSLSGGAAKEPSGCARGDDGKIVKGFVDQVVIICDGKEIARHKRAYERGSFICDPLHSITMIWDCYNPKS